MSRKSSEPVPTPEKLRLDLWLWAARFFKTRSLAKQAVEGGKVRRNGERCKASREVAPGDLLEIQRGWDELTVIVRGISPRRLGAPQAVLLYEETPESAQKRQVLAERRRLERAVAPVTDGRPGKKDRRLIHRFKQRSLDNL